MSNNEAILDLLMEQNRVLQDTVQQQSQLIETQKQERTAMLDALVVDFDDGNRRGLCRTCSLGDITKSMKAEQYGTALKTDIELQVKERTDLVESIVKLKTILENHKLEVKCVLSSTKIVKKEFEEISEDVVTTAKTRDSLNSDIEELWEAIESSKDIQKNLLTEIKDKRSTEISILSQINENKLVVAAQQNEIDMIKDKRKLLDLEMIRFQQIHNEITSEVDRKIAQEVVLSKKIRENEKFIKNQEANISLLKEKSEYLSSQTWNQSTETESQVGTDISLEQENYQKLCDTIQEEEDLLTNIAHRIKTKGVCKSVIDEEQASISRLQDAVDEKEKLYSDFQENSSQLEQVKAVSIKGDSSCLDKAVCSTTPKTDLHQLNQLPSKCDKELQLLMVDYKEDIEKSDKKIEYEENYLKKLNLNMVDHQLLQPNSLDKIIAEKKVKSIDRLLDALNDKHHTTKKLVKICNQEPEEEKVEDYRKLCLQSCFSSIHCIKSIGVQSMAKKDRPPSKASGQSLDKPVDDIPSINIQESTSVDDQSSSQDLPHNQVYIDENEKEIFMSKHKNNKYRKICYEIEEEISKLVHLEPKLYASPTTHLIHEVQKARNKYHDLIELRNLMNSSINVTTPGNSKDVQKDRFLNLGMIIKAEKEYREILIRQRQLPRISARKMLEMKQDDRLAASRIYKANNNLEIMMREHTRLINLMDI